MMKGLWNQYKITMMMMMITLSERVHPHNSNAIKVASATTNIHYFEMNATTHKMDMT